MSEISGDEYTEGLYAKRGRADSLGKDSSQGDMFADEQILQEDVYMPRKRDTFHLRRGTVDQEDEDDYGHGGGDTHQSPSNGLTRPKQRRGSGDSSNSDGDGYGGGIIKDRLWSEANSGGGGDYMYGNSSSENVNRGRIVPDSPLKNSLLTNEDDQVFMSNNQDLVEQIADEKAKMKKRERNRRRFYQCIVFFLCYFLNFINRVREQFIRTWQGCSEGAVSSQVYCNDFQYSVMISSGIGFIFLGNIYDNIEKPRQVTTLLLVIISIITLIEAIFSNEFKDQQDQKINVSFTLFQMSSLFEAGITLVCIVILHNWFKEEILGTVTALWATAQYLQVIVQKTIYDNLPVEESNNSVVDTLKWESYSLFGCYLLLSIICWFFFWHHPSHIGIKIRESHDNSNSFGFVVDNTTTHWNPTATQVSTQGRRNINSTMTGQTTSQSMLQTTHHQSRFGNDDDMGVGGEQTHDDPDVAKMDVTLIDAFKIKEINLLIASYIFAMCHNLYILKSTRYTGALDQRWLSFGSIIGIICSGALVDLVFKKRRFLTILMLNCFITVFDLYLYTIDKDPISKPFTFFLGAVMPSNNIVYLILLPMLIAKQHSEEMANMAEFQRVSYAGTIVGVVIALCAVGKYLFSDNLATLLEYWTKDVKHEIYSDLITSGLQLIAVLIILGPIREEFRESHILSQLNCCCKRRDSESEGEEGEIADIYQQNKGSSIYQRSPDTFGSDPLKSR